MKWTETDGSVCSISTHHRRSRKTGPCHRVVVAKCATHRVSFTLYPPGYVPYARVGMAPVGGDGKPLHEVEDSEPGGVDPEVGVTPEPDLAWDLTVFRAARDAEQGLAWPRKAATLGAMGSWRSQGRWIAIAAACLGLTTDDNERWPLVGLLDVPALVWREARAAHASAKGYVARGRAVTLILGALGRTGCRLLDMLLEAGFRAGRWGEPRRWDRRAQRLCHLARLPRPP